jgi:hypothetical protein
MKSGARLTSWGWRIATGEVVSKAKKPKKLPTWRITRIRKKAEYLTTLAAPDAASAEAKFVKDRGITDPAEKRRLMAVREG